MSKSTPSAALVLASSLTKIHPGAGRSPGVVDLPVVRDPLGYPYIPGTMIKGSLRSLLHKDGAPTQDIECLFGPDVRASSKYAGALTFHDLYPLLLPAPSSEHGVVYVTTPSLLGRAATMAEAAGDGKLASALTSMARDAIREAVLVGAPNEGEARVGAFRIRYKPAKSSEGIDVLAQRVRRLHRLYEAVPLQGRILVVPENVGPRMIDSLMVRVTRVRLNRETKTVETGGLWTEEYLPWGTLFTGLIVDNRFRGENCSNLGDPINKLLSLLGLRQQRILDLVVGGKETVGGGLLRVML